MNRYKSNTLVTWLITTVIGVLLALTILPLVNAQERPAGGGLRVAPGPIPLEIEAGSSETIDLIVRNITPSPVKVGSHLPGRQ